MDGRPSRWTTTIGLSQRGKYVLRELYPLEGRLIGKPGTGSWSWGDTVSREMDGGSALVLQIVPAEKSDEPVLYNSPGTATAGRQRRCGSRASRRGRDDGGPADRRAVREGHGRQIGATTRCPCGGKSGLDRSARAPSRARASATISSSTTYRRDFTGGAVEATFRVPQRVFDQLAARRKAWPIPWTEEDLPQHLARAGAPAAVRADRRAGRPVDRVAEDRRPAGGAHEGVRLGARQPAKLRRFLRRRSRSPPDVEHRLELEVPTGLKPGQFQGVFFENVETEYTGPSSNLPQSAPPPPPA